jgi:hypothetical protein
MKEIRKTHCRDARGSRKVALGDNIAGDAFLLPRVIGKAFFQIIALWFHVGVGPMIGMGPMDRRPRSRAGRSASLTNGRGHQFQPPIAAVPPAVRDASTASKVASIDPFQSISVLKHRR